MWLLIRGPSGVGCRPVSVSVLARPSHPLTVLRLGQKMSGLRDDSAKLVLETFKARRSGRAFLLHRAHHPEAI
jgi:hypothetical protein